MRTQDPRQRFQTDGMHSVSPMRLVVLLYERATRDVAEGRAAIVDGRPAERHRCLVHAQEIIEELSYAVRPDLWDGGDSLLAVYEYVLELLVKANVSNNLRALDEAATLIAELSTAWHEAYVALQDTTSL